MKLIGGITIILCCSWFGFSLAAAHRREEIYIRQLISALDYMQCELQYRLTALPELCSQVSQLTIQGTIAQFFQLLSQLLDAHQSSQVQPCVAAALEQAGNLPPGVRLCIEELGKHLGQFDLDGQLSGLEATRKVCREHLTRICTGKENQRRSYQTLGLCAGAALVIIFI